MALSAGVENWANSFQKCQNSGVGSSRKQEYRGDGSSYNALENEDRWIYCCIDDSNKTFLYGVLDGEGGLSAVDFISLRIINELAYGRLSATTPEDAVKDIFREAFVSAESAYFESIDPKIAERAQLLEKVSDLRTKPDGSQQYPDAVSRLQDLELELNCGSSAVVCLLHNGRLYVASVGHCRALLCQKDKSGVLRVNKLTEDSSKDVSKNLLDVGFLSFQSKEGAEGEISHPNDSSRSSAHCLGNFLLKERHKELHKQKAVGDGSFGEPRICSVPLNDSGSFLLLMSGGLCRTYEQALSSESMDKGVAQMVLEQFLEHHSLESVAQSVVNKIVQLHQDSHKKESSKVNLREDSTLLIRNFNFRSPQSFSQLRNVPVLVPEYNKRLEVCKSSSSSSDDLTFYNYGEDILGEELSEVEAPLRLPDEPESTEPVGNDTTSVLPSSTSTESSRLSNPSLNQFTLDEDGRISGYVNFDDYYRKLEEAIADGTIPPSQVSFYK